MVSFVIILSWYLFGVNMVFEYLLLFARINFMENIEDNNEVRFTMRMDGALYEELKAQAKFNRRSIAKELENIVDFYFHKDDCIEIPKSIAKELERYINNWLKAHSENNK